MRFLNNIILTSSVFIVIGLVLTKCVNLTTRIILARSLGAYDFGIIATIWSFSSIFSTIAIPGIGPMTTRYLSLYYNSNDIKSAKGVILESAKVSLIASILLCLIGILLSSKISPRWGIDPENSSLLVIAFITVVPWVALTWTTAVFRGIGLTIETVITRDLIKSGLAITLLYSFHIVDKLTIKTALIYIYCFPVLFASLLAIFLVHSRLKKLFFNVKGFVINRKEWCNYAWPLSLSTLLQNVAGKSIDLLVIGYLTTPEIVGIYFAALSIANIGGLMMQGVNYISLPIMSVNGSNTIKKNYKKSREVAIEVLFPFTVCILIWPHIITKLFFGEVFDSAGLVVSILIAGQLFSSYIGPIGQLLLSQGKTKVHLIADLVSIILFLLLAVILIPKHGAVGAAIARLASQICINTICVLPFIRDGYIEIFRMEPLKYPLIMLLLGLIVKLTEKLQFIPYGSGYGLTQYAPVSTALVLCSLVVIFRITLLYKTAKIS